MDRRTLGVLVTIGIGLTCGLLGGCAASLATQAAPVDESPGRDFGAQDDVAGAGSPVNAFGERGDADSASNDTHMLTNVTQHTFSTVGRDFDPDISPDGSSLAFASTSHNERPDIYLKHPDGFAITQLTSDPADDVQPRFSPDGQRIVFCSNRAGNWDLWVVRLDGTGLIQLTHDGTDEIAPTWSPDGTRIAFSVWGRRSHQWEIWTLAVDHPGVRHFLCYGLFPDWAPDGTRIAYQRARQRGTRWFSVWVVTLTGNEARNPTEIAYSDRAACIAPRWAPDGRSVLCCTIDGAATGTATPERGMAPASDLWAVDAGSGVRRKLTNGEAAAFNPVSAGDGRVYYVSLRGGVENIWSLAGEGGAAAPGEPAAARDTATPLNQPNAIVRDTTDRP